MLLSSIPNPIGKINYISFITVTRQIAVLSVATQHTMLCKNRLCVTLGYILRPSLSYKIKNKVNKRNYEK